MIRHLAAAAGAVIVVVGFPLAPQAAADDGQVLAIEGGKVLCAFSADNVPRGGGSMVVCQHANGDPWGQAEWAFQVPSAMLDLAIERGDGRFMWTVGRIDGSPSGSVGAGQTQHVNGWTIEGRDMQTVITNDATGHGIFVDVAQIRTF